MAGLICFGLIAVCCYGRSCMQLKNDRDCDAFAEQTIGLHFIQRACYIIIAPIALVDIVRSLEKITDNQDKIESL